MLMLFALETTLQDFAWVGCCSLQDLRKVASDSGWVKRLMSGIEGDALRLDDSEENLVDDSVSSHAELSENSERMSRTSE
jgi:hypothetical protein